MTMKQHNTHLMNTAMQTSFIHQFSFPHLGVKELLEYIGALVVIGVRLVKRPAVREQSRHVGNKQVLVNVVVTLQTVAYRLQICRNILPVNKIESHFVGQFFHVQITISTAVFDLFGRLK